MKVDGNLVLFYLAANLASLGCVVGAYHLAMADLPGWGWFLFVAVCLSASPKIKSEATNKPDESATT